MALERETNIVNRRVSSDPTGVSRAPSEQLFLGHEQLSIVSGLRKDGRLDEAEAILLRSKPSQAVLDEFRKIASVRARLAKKVGDWEAVVRHLESYRRLAQERRDECLRMVNAEPPPLSPRDATLLEQARQRTN
jgi:hypothetical protein